MIIIIILSNLKFSDCYYYEIQYIYIHINIVFILKYAELTTETKSL